MNRAAQARLFQANMLPSLGLGGDGDEIEAIRDVERDFGVTLDYSDASTWTTSGDVFRSLCSALGPGRCNDPDLWPRFASAIAKQTDVDPMRISRETLLLAPATPWLKAAIISSVLGAGTAILFFYL